MGLPPSGQGVTHRGDAELDKTQLTGVRESLSHLTFSTREGGTNLSTDFVAGVGASVCSAHLCSRPRVVVKRVDCPLLTLLTRAPPRDHLEMLRIVDGIY